MKSKTISILLCIAVFLQMLTKPQIALAEAGVAMQLTNRPQALNASEISEYTKQFAQARSAGLLKVAGGSDDTAGQMALGILFALILIGVIAAATADPSE